MQISPGGPRGKKSTGPPRPECGNLFNNTCKRSLGTKTATRLFMGYEIFSAKFEECNFQDMYSYVYIPKYHFYI